MAKIKRRRKPSDIYDHISPLDIKCGRRPSFAWVRDLRTRMKKAALADKVRRTTLKGWQLGQFKNRVSRLGTQTGKSRAECTALAAVAELRVQDFIKMMEDEGFLDLSDVIVPDSDEALAKAGMTELARLALGPTDKRTKLYAVDKLLSYVKAKPVQRIDAKVSSVESWLEQIKKDND